MMAVARPYARAAFEVAKTHDAVSYWSLTLRQLSLAIQEEKMQWALKDPQWERQQLVNILIGFLHDVANDAQKNDFEGVENLIRLLSEKQRLSVIPAISTAFEEILSQDLGRMAVTVTSAFTMDDAARNRIKEALSRYFQRKLTMDFQVDTHLIGGLLVRSDQRVMDGTLSGQLKRLTVALS